MQLNPSEISELIKSRIQNLDAGAQMRTQGTVVSVTDGICRIHGLSDAQVAELAQRLERKTGRKIRAKLHVDKELIAGVRIVVGDKVIDGSVRAQLGALESALKS